MFSTTADLPSNSSAVTTGVPYFDNTDHEHPLMTTEQQIIIPVVVAILAVWSILGNTVTILAIALYRRMQTKCNFFILSLAISDLLSAAIASPLWLYRRIWGYKKWEWDRFLCKFFWFADESTSYCTALHIASFAILRFIGVRWPKKFEEIKRKAIVIYLLSLWILAIIFGGIIFCGFYDVEDRFNTSHSCWPMCSIRISNNGVEKHQIYYTFSSATFMMLPMLILIIASLLIVRELRLKHWTKSQNRKEKEKKAAIQLGLIASSFLIGYIPMMTYVMWTTRGHKNNSCSFDHWFNIGAYIALRFSEGMNPIAYNLACRKMRKASIGVLWKVRTCCRYQNKEAEEYSKEYRKRISSKSKKNSSGKVHVCDKQQQIQQINKSITSKI